MLLGYFPMFDIVLENSGIVFYAIQVLYFGRFCIFVEQWVIYSYANIREVFTIKSIIVFYILNGGGFVQPPNIILNRFLYRTDYRSLL